MRMPRSTVNFVPSSLGFLLNDISRTFRRHFDIKMAEHGLTQAQWRALLIMATREGCTQRELSDALDVQPISIARLLDRMVKGGWVKRAPCPNDRRAHRLYLTSRCDPILEVAKAASQEVLSRANQGISEAELAQLLGTLERIKNNLDQTS